MQKATGKFLVVSVDSQGGTAFEIAEGEIREEFDSLADAEAATCWDVYLERAFHTWVKNGGEGERPPAHDHKEQPPPAWFIENLGEEKRKIKAGDHCTSEFMYIYDPEGNRIDRVHV